jgi:hypothetical protein
MAIVVPSASEKTLVDFMLGVLVPGNQKVKLFVNNVTPDDSTVLATLTEMSTHGYAEKTLTKTSWVSAAGASGQPASSAYAQQTWTFTAATAVSVYGYYVTDTTTGLLLWVERFASPKVVENVGDQILITPTLTLSRSA